MTILKPSAAMTETWTFFEDEWHYGNVAIMGPRTHGAWLGSTVFDGARYFEGVAPDLDLHCQRINASATSLLLKPVVSVERWLELAWDGIKRFASGTDLYIRPMYWAEDGAAGGGVRFDPDSTRWCLSIYQAAMPVPSGGPAITLSPFRRPTNECALVEAKAGSLYSNNSRALIEAYHRGFGNCVLRDMLGNVAELANSNIFMAKDGVVYTPAANGVFLNGITRQRVIGLLNAAGTTVVETTLRYSDFETADEIFSTGNFLKVSPISRIEQRALPEGPIYKQARELYWDFAHSRPAAARAA